ncbi:MAG: TonB-dependent receptor [Flavobacteriales bacterium]
MSKGIGTAVNGPNAMTGQIDLCLLSPLDADRLFTNLYVNSQGRTELNVNAAQRTGTHSANVLMMQGNLFQQEMDQNHDGFMDQPRTKRFNVMDRWMMQTDKRTTQAALRYVTDERRGGQLERMAGEHSGHPRYAVDIDNKLVDAFVKNGWIMGPLGRTSIGLIAAGRLHTANAAFGERSYEGEQRSGYLSAVYQQVMTNNDQLKAGLTYQFDDYTELYRAGAAPTLDLGRTERTPGAFAEYTRSRKGITLVGGLRADANSYYGTVVSPRLHVKYDIGPLTTIRFSSGRAFRSANPLVENASALASSRAVVVEGPLGLERAWNNGISFLHKFKWAGKKWAVGVDAYRTDLTDQVVADLDRSPQVLALYMLKGASFANSVLADIQVGLTRQLDLKVSYRWYDVRTTYGGVLRERPFVPTHRGLLDLAYTSRNEQWRFDITLNGFGTARIPDTQSDPEGHRLPQRSPAYATLNAQLSRVLGAWEVYVGGENLTSTLQQRQIIAPEDPFGPYFDASMIWGPTNTAMVYGGVRFTLKKKASDTPTHE